jgi:hypothetical protein
MRLAKYKDGVHVTFGLDGAYGSIEYTNLRGRGDECSTCMFCSSDLLGIVRKRLRCYFPQNIFVTALHQAESTSLVTVGGTLVRFMMSRYPQAVGMKCEAYNGGVDCVLGCLFLF